MSDMVENELHWPEAEELARIPKRTDTSGPNVNAALVAAEARLQLVMQAANIGFWDWDIKSNTVYHSPEWKRQLGYEVNEISHEITEWQSRLHPDDCQRVRGVVDDFMSQPRPEYELEFRLRHRDGAYRWIHSKGLLLKDAHGKPSRMMGVHVDISASKAREDELRKSEERFRRLVETTCIIPWEADAKTWQFGYVGPRASTLLGYPVKDWFRRGFWVSHLHPDDRSAAVKFRRQQSRRCTDFQSEYRMISADGHAVWFHDVVHVLGTLNKPVTLQGFLVDISQRKQAAEDHALLAAIVESSNDAIIGEDLDGTITSWNKSAERIYGYSASEAIGRSVRMLAPRERTQEVTDILDQMRRGEIVEHLETLRIRKDGRPIHVSLVVSPIRGALGTITGASAIVRDITERKQLEAEVLRISEREEQRIAQDLHDGLGQLLSGTVHLASVLQLQLAEQALPEAGQALRITELLNQAVAEARGLARGLYPVRPESNGLLAALEELAARTQKVFGVACTVQCPKPVLISDNAAATHFYRIAQEAVTNALKHGGARRIQIVLTASSSRTVLLIRDDGSGFSHGGSGRNGLGIRIMQYRASIMGGAFAIRTPTRGGVRVVCTVPHA